MKKISIVIPIYNENENIENLYNEIIANLSNKFIFEIIFINDGSTDNSKDIINKIIKSSFHRVLCIDLKKNKGQSLAIFSGINSSKYECIVTIDADLQNNSKDISKLVDLFYDYEYSLVGGIRYNRKDTFIKKISSIIANYIRSSMLNDGCIDTGCSLKAFKKSVFIQFPFFDGMHRFLPALFRGYGEKTYFVDVDHRPRVYGVSKYGTFLRMIKGIRDIVKVLIIIQKYKKYERNND